MKQLSIIFMLVGILCACGNDNSQNKLTQGRKSETKIEVVDGAKIYKRNCVSCHGSRGDMGVNGAKNLTESTMTKAERVAIITNGKGVMTPFKGMLKPAEIEAVADFTLSLKK